MLLSNTFVKSLRAESVCSNEILTSENSILISKYFSSMGCTILSSTQGKSQNCSSVCVEKRQQGHENGTRIQSRLVKSVTDYEGQI